MTPLPTVDPLPELPELPPLRANLNGYALGFGIRACRGHKMVSTPAVGPDT